MSMNLIDLYIKIQNLIESDNNNIHLPVVIYNPQDATCEPCDFCEISIEDVYDSSNMVCNNKKVVKLQF